MDVTQWRKEREALLDRLYHLEGGGAGRSRNKQTVTDSIARLNERIAELDAKFAEASSA